MTTEYSGQDTAKIAKETPGQDTLRRFKYQLEYVVLRWLESLGHPGHYIVSELDEDAEVVRASIERERIQVKTLSSGYWGIRSLTSKATPVLQSFAEQYAEDNELTFRFVSNGSAASDLRDLRRILTELRAGGELNADDKGSLRRCIDTVRRRVGKHIDVLQLLERVEFDTDFAGIDDLAYRVREAIARASASTYNTTISPDQVKRIHDLLLGITLERSSSRYVGDRTLTSMQLDDVFRRETRRIEIGGSVDLVKLEKTVSILLERVERGEGALPSPSVAVPESLLSSEERQRLRELAEKLTDPSSYSVVAVRIGDRMDLAHLLERAGQFSEAEDQYAKALEEAQGYDESICQVIFYCANFLARQNPHSSLLLPYVDNYLALALGSSSLRWVQAANVFGYIRAVHGNRVKKDYLRVLYEYLKEKDAGQLALVDTLHWHETMAMLEAIQRHPDAAIGHFHSLLAGIDEVPIYPYTRVRNVLMAVEPLLRDSGQFTALFEEFSDFCQRKEAWGSRADLYKELAMRRYNSGEYAEAIPLLRVADEGYMRVGATRAFLLTHHVVAHCNQQLGRFLGAMKESMNLSLIADVYGIRDLALIGIREAIGCAFDLGLLLDSFFWGITYARIANAYNDEAEMEEASQLLVYIYSELSRTRTREELVVAKRILFDWLLGDDGRDLFNSIELAAFGSNEEWEKYLETEADPQLLSSKRELRGRIQESGIKDAQERQRIEISVEGLSLVGDWSAQPQLKWLILGLFAWFEQYGRSLIDLFSELDDTLEVRAGSFADAPWAIERYEYVKTMTDSGLPSVLPGMTKDRKPRAVIVVPDQVWQATEGRIGEIEILCMMQATMQLRAMNLGEEERVAADKFERQVLVAHSFEHRIVIPLGTSQDRLGGFML